MDGLESALCMLPEDLASSVRNCEKAAEIEELRLHQGSPLQLWSGRWKHNIVGNRSVTAQDIRYILSCATGASFHSTQDSICRGYLTAPGGCRIGLCGEGAAADGHIRTLRNISSICIRIPHAVPGCADLIFPEILNESFHNTLIVSPPGTGKTTLLRELIRKLSDAGFRISVADERGEVAAMHQGIPQFDLGARTDVLSNVAKCEAGIMMIRTMAPDVLAMDEITASADLPAVREAVGCGVGLLATVHGSSVQELKRKPLFSALFSCGAFEKAICIRMQQGYREYRTVVL